MLYPFARDLYEIAFFYAGKGPHGDLFLAGFFGRLSGKLKGNDRIAVFGILIHYPADISFKFHMFSQKQTPVSF